MSQLVTESDEVGTNTSSTRVDLALEGEEADSGRLQALECVNGEQSRTWHEDVERVRDHLGDEAASQVLKKIRDSAEEKLISGGRAYECVQGPTEQDIESEEKFFVLLNGLRRAWMPKNAMEDLLVTQIAQAQCVYEKWISEHMNQAKGVFWQGGNANTQSDAFWNGRSLDKAEALEFSQTMAQRWQNQMLRLIRCLRDLRKVGQQVFIANAGQVNVGEQQINLGSSHSND